MYIMKLINIIQRCNPVMGQVYFLVIVRVADQLDAVHTLPK